MRLSSPPSNIPLALLAVHLLSTSGLAAAMPAMKSVQITKYGRPDDVLEMTHTRERPILTKGTGQMLLKVHAVSLTPGDQRRMSGDVSGAPITLPPFPYVPCGDVCGTVLEVDENEPNLAFKVTPPTRANPPRPSTHPPEPPPLIPLRVWTGALNPISYTRNPKPDALNPKPHPWTLSTRAGGGLRGGNVG